MTSCSAWRLYVIIDRAAAADRPVRDLAEAALRGGADAIQLRDKRGADADVCRTARELLPMTRAAGVPLIINDRADVARTVGAEGVHLGQEDLPIASARTLLGAGCLIGKSTHSLEQAISAEREGADYLGCGPLFATPTKPDYHAVGLELVGTVSRAVRIPVVYIGGVDPGNLADVLAAGAERVAVVRAVCAAADPESATRELKVRLTQFVRSTTTG